MKPNLEKRAHDALLRYHFPGAYSTNHRTWTEEFQQGFLQGHMLAELEHRAAQETEKQEIYE